MQLRARFGACSVHGLSLHVFIAEFLVFPSFVLLSSPHPPVRGILQVPRDSVFIFLFIGTDHSPGMWNTRLDCSSNRSGCAWCTGKVCV